MNRPVVCSIALLLLAHGLARAQEPDAKGDKVLSGMSILGNDDAPMSLVIVPWKTAGLGDALDVGMSLGGGRQPIDREVFMRELVYYEIRSGSAESGGSNRR